MSVRAGTIQGTRTSISTGAWITAILLATMVTLALFTMTRSSGTSDSAPTTAKFESTVPVGFSHVAPTTGGEPWEPIVVNGAACHQCL